MLRTCEDHKHSATTRRKAPVCGTRTPRPGGFRFVRPLFLARRVLEQNRRQRGRKVYSLHAPEVECIGKGKAHGPQKAPECKTAHPPTRRSFLATHGLTPSLRPSPLRPRSRHPLPRYVRSVPASRQRALRALLRPPHVRWPAQHRQSPLSSSVTREERKGLYFLHRLIWREDHDARPCEEARYQLLAQRPFLVEALAVVTREDRRKIISTESEYSSSNRRDRSSNQRTPGRASAPNRTRAARRPIRSGARRAEVLADETAASALTRRGRRHLPSHVKAGAARLIPAHRAASAHTAASRVVRTSAGDRRTIAMLILRPQAKL